MKKYAIKSRISRKFLKGTIQTFSNELIQPLCPKLSVINVIDIAHSLSMKCRFSGHTKAFYSVAQHAVLVSRLLEAWGYGPLTQYKGLHHDDSEAYLVDLPTPLKKLRQFRFFRKQEELLQNVIFKALGLKNQDCFEPKVVKRADRRLLATEKRDLMQKSQWLLRIKPLSAKIKPWSWQKAKKEYLKRDKELRAMLLEWNRLNVKK